MQESLKRYVLVLCLFVFLFVTLGAGFHLNPAGAFVAALSGTPLVIFAFNCWYGVKFRQNHASPTSSQRESALPH